MKEEEINEGNKAIAEFMSRKIVDTPWPHKPIEEQGVWVYALGQEYFKESIKYNTSWNWLMPVIEKISSLSYNESNNRFSPSVDRFLENDIEAVWCEVVEFIEWFNEKKQWREG